MSEAVGSDYPWDYDYPPGPGLLLNTYLGTPLIAQADLTEDGRTFSSWAEKFGPHEFHGDNFTSLIRWNLSDPGAKAYSTFMPNGYGNRTNVVSERPFQAEDIIILTDGYCASTCKWALQRPYVKLAKRCRLDICRVHDEAGQCQDCGHWR